MIRNILIEKRGDRTQSEIANSLGITQKYLSKIELGLRNPSIKLLASFCNIYNEKAEILFPDIFLNKNTPNKNL